jgi:hypothetical protein
MIEFGDSQYYIDLDTLDKLITLKGSKVDEVTVKTITNQTTGVITVEKEEFTRKSEEGKTIDMAKYDMLKYFIELLVEDESVDDDSLGSERALNKASLAYKIVFNTLLKENVLKEAE